MSDPALLVAVFWVLFLLDGVEVSRRARWSLLSLWGGRRARPAWRRWHVLSPWPGGWRAMADDLPFSLAPAGLCNWPAGAAGRPANEPAALQAWRWEDIADVREQDGQLIINGKKFCTATGHLRADELRALAAACGPLAAGARAALLRAQLSGWLRPAHLRRRTTVLRARTSALVTANVVALAGLAALSAWLLGWLSADSLGPAAAALVAQLLPEGLASLVLLHVGGLGLAWWERRRLRRLARGGGPQKNPLPAALCFPPAALRLRALLGADWFPPSHPGAVALAVARPAARDEVVFNVLADLRWPLTPAGGGPLVGEVLAWYRSELGGELEHLLRREKIDVAALFTPPVPDGAASRAYCPRCRAQFVTEGGSCPQGVPLRPLK